MALPMWPKLPKTLTPSHFSIPGLWHARAVLPQCDREGVKRAPLALLHHLSQQLSLISTAKYQS